METLEELRARRKQMEDDLARDMRWNLFWNVLAVGLLVFAVAMVVLALTAGAMGILPTRQC